MEGFVARRRSPSADPWLEARILHRWIAFMFLAMMGLVMLIYLSAAAFSV